MTRLIDADALIVDLQHRCSNKTFYKQVKESLIDCAPTIDAVEVIRCKECVWSREKDENEQRYLVEGVLICTNSEAVDSGWNPVFSSHFCSYGERRG